MSDSTTHLVASHEDVLRVLQATYPDIYHRCVAEAVAFNAQREIEALRAALAEAQADPTPDE